MPSPLGHALAGLAAGWLVAGPAPCRAGDEAALSSATLPTAQPRTCAGAGRWWGAFSQGLGNRKRAAAFVVAAVVPDLDLLAGVHSGWTHSVGAALVAMAVALAWPAASGHSRRAPRHIVMAVAVAAAYLTHPLLDWLGQDDHPPIGVMLLWPFSHAYFHSGLDWFLAISRRYWLPGFWTSNARSIAREVMLLAPPALLVLALRGRQRGAATDHRAVSG